MKKYSRFQKVLAAAQAKNEAVLVVGPSAGDVILSSTEVVVAQHKCTTKDCGCEIVVNRLSSPACPVCAGVMEPSGEDITFSYKEIKDELVALASCEGCGHDIGSTAQIVAASEGFKCACPVCAEPITVKASEDEEVTDEDEEYSEDDGDETEDEDEYEADSEEEEIEASDDEDEEVTDEDTSESDEDEEDEIEASETDEPAKVDLAPTPDAASIAAKPDTVTSEVDPAAVAPETPAVAETPVAETPVAEKIELEVSPLEAYRDDENGLKLVASSEGDKGALKWYLIANDTIVATAIEDRAASSVKSFFHNVATFNSAFSTALSAEGADDSKVLKDFGFEKAKTTIAVDLGTKAFIDEQVALKTKASVENSKEAEEKFKTCYSIASMGVRKGTYGIVPPLFTKLCDVLAKAGMENPHTIVAAALEEAGAEEQAIVLSKASELMTQTPEAVNAQSDMVKNAISALTTVASTPARAKGFTVVTESLIPAAPNSEVASVKTDKRNVAAVLTAGLGARNSR